MLTLPNDGHACMKTLLLPLFGMPLIGVSSPRYMLSVTLIVILAHTHSEKLQNNI